MPGLVPGIHVLKSPRKKTWMAGTSPAMTASLEDHRVTTLVIPAKAGIQ
jgi:hypothetical protein